jgi:hypothetical protein
MPDKPVRPTNADPNNESGRISRSGTSAGISIGSESTSGGKGPIPPGGKPRNKPQGDPSDDTQDTPAHR